MREIYRKGILSVLILITVLAACKKESTPKQQSTTLYLKSITPKGTLAFTKYGQVIVQSFVDRAAEATGLNIFYPPQFSKDSMSFLTDRHLQWGNGYYTYVNANSRFVFSGDTNPADPTFWPVTHALFFKEPGITIHSNGDMDYTRKFIGNGDLSSLHISYVIVCILRRDSLTNKITLREQNPILNEFNWEGAKTLGKNDTLAVRAYTFDYVKK